MIPPQPAPCCGYALDGSPLRDIVGDGVMLPYDPRPGDFTVCCGCGSLLRFTLDRRVRQLMRADLVDLKRLSSDDQLFLCFVVETIRRHRAALN